MQYKGIKVNVITGFLGSGKTTLIKQLLEQVPEGERWAVLVNEFGEVGIDGELLKSGDIAIKQVPGGCLCCVSSAAFSVGLNELIKTAKPDRILIEPTGIGHPDQIVEQLSAKHYHGVLEVCGTVCLMDVRNLSDPRYLGHPAFFDQIDDADILIASKADLYSSDDELRFLQFAKQFEPAKSVIALSDHGGFDQSWLDVPRVQQHSHHDHDHDHDHGVITSQSSAGVMCYQKRDLDMASIGWVADSNWFITSERFEQFLAYLSEASHFWRFKGIIRIDDVFEQINMTQTEMRRSTADEVLTSRFECVFSITDDYEKHLNTLHKTLF